MLGASMCLRVLVIVLVLYTMLYWTSACLPLASRVSMGALEALTGPLFWCCTLISETEMVRHAFWGTDGDSNSQPLMVVTTRWHKSKV